MSRRERVGVLFILKTILAGIALALAESALGGAIDVSGIRPDLAVLAVVAASSRADFRKTMTVACVLGLTRDYFSVGIVGMNAFSLACMTYFLASAQNFLLTENWSAQVFVTFLGCMVFGIVFMFLKGILGYEIGPVLRVALTGLGVSCYTALLAPPVFWVLAKRPRFPSYLRLKKDYDVEHKTLPPTEV